ncbi:efflux transporter outer membrane subunit [Methylomonas sp. AM2-LC]|uniref:efflux transporter outer membrane subunit n=1 Tax=Methylomonas sp. AM2-LC TaxID=3153301 RepID=UPI0032660360
MTNNANNLSGVRLPLLILLVLMLDGCMVGPDYQPPKANVPEQWLSADNPQATKANLEVNWWHSFNDALLDQLIEKALHSNPDLKIAETRISEERAARASAFAALLPTGDLMGSANRQANQLGFPSGGGGPTAISTLVKQPFNIFKTGFDASWELDLFGGHRRQLESAQAELEASAISHEDILISTLAEVARNYIDIRLYQAQLDIAQSTYAADQKTTALMQERVKIGEAPGIDTTRAESQQEHDRAQIAYFSNLLAQTNYGMDVLLGEKPGATQALLNSTATPIAVPMSDKQLILEAPAKVIAKRPDIRIAERKLASATAQQGVAVAKFFPDVSLSGFIGLFNTNAGNLLNVSSKSWGMGASVLWPILSYGVLAANLDAADAKQQEVLANYQKSILSALADVERSYTAYTEQEKYFQAQDKAVAADQHVFTIADERYQQGLTSYLDVLDAERTYNASRNQLMVAKAQTALNLIAVYKSLGGSWQLPTVAVGDAGRLR